MAQGGDPTGTGTGGPRPARPAGRVHQQVPLHPRHLRHGPQPEPEQREQPVLHHVRAGAEPRRPVHHLGPRLAGMDAVDKIKRGAPGSGTVTGPDKLIRATHHQRLTRIIGQRRFPDDQTQPTPAPGNTLILELKDGPVTIELLPELAPKHVERDQAARRPRLLRRHALPPGDRGLHGPGRRPDRHRHRRARDLPDLPAEFNETSFQRGVCGMARSQSPNSANSQFFICFARREASSTASTPSGAG